MAQGILLLLFSIKVNLQANVRNFNGFTLQKRLKFGSKEGEHAIYEV